MSCSIRATPNNLEYCNEITQADNLNATSRLWIQKNGMVYKQYIIYNQIAEKNIHNLLLVSSIKALYRIPEITMPIEIYEQDGKIADYLMKYHQGQSLGQLMEKHTESEMVLQAFRQAATVINKLPSTALH